MGSYMQNDIEPYYKDSFVTLYHGSSESIIPHLSGVTAVVTDPPAGIGFMSKSWDSNKGGRSEWIAWLAGVLASARGACLPGAPMLCWAIPRTSHWTGMAIEDAGWLVRDRISHIFGSGFPKSHNLHKSTQDDAWAGYGTALKPAMEDWWLAMKPLDGTFAANALQYGVAGLNVDGGRVGTFTPAPHSGGMERLNAANHKQGYRPNPYRKDLTGQMPCDTVGSNERTPSWEPEQIHTSIAAGIAESAMNLIEQGTRPSSAIESAVSHLSAEQRTSLFGTSKPDMSCFDGLLAAAPSTKESTSTSSSTDTCGKKPTGAKCQQATSSITRTATAKTIASTILNLCREAHTENCTTPSTTQEKNPSRPVRNSNASAAPAGRWPANILHDGSDEVLAGFPVTAPSTAHRRGAGGGGDHIGQLSQRPDGVRGPTDKGTAARFFKCCPQDEASGTLHDLIEGLPPERSDMDIIGAMCESLDEHELAAKPLGDAKIGDGNAYPYRPQDAAGVAVDGRIAARFFYCAKASKAERNRGCEGLPLSVGGGMAGTADKSLKTGSGNERNNLLRNDHATVKPLALMRYLCTLVTMPERNLLLDPFAGSGTTGVACKELGLPCVLIEQDEHHCEIIAARCAAAVIDKRLIPER